MVVKSFRVKNYRSIKDSGVCYLSGDNITVLAGKNEAGKTAILEALEDFNLDEKIREEAVPLHNKEIKPEIFLHIQLTKKELKSFFTDNNLAVKKNDNIIVQIEKSYPSYYDISENSLIEIGVIEKDHRIKTNTEFTQLVQQLNTYHTKYSSLGNPPKYTYLSWFKKNFSTYETSISSNLNTLQNEEVRKEIQNLINDIKSKLELEDKRKESIKKAADDIVKKIPNFILFKTFDDIFPSRILITEAKENELIKDLALISDLDLELIESDSTIQKARHKDQLNVKMRREYKRFWTQDLTNLYIDWENNELIFLIKERNDFYPPDYRSKGKQWHLAFYVRVTARSKENVQNIVLIDEPGLFLHAKAQEDILRKLEDISKHTLIIFSTHSPYLLDVNKLNRIRLVLKNNSNTTISNKIHLDSDKETLTPIITAIGLDISKGLDITKNYNLIVEGISDYYYLIGFKNLLNFKFKKDLNIIPSTGADNVVVLNSLLFGWGLKSCTLLDNDHKGKEIAKKIKKHFGEGNINLMHISEQTDYCTEDLIDRNDFIKYALSENTSTEDRNKRNSQVVKKYDKVLISKIFCEKITKNEIQLSNNTTTNFHSLFKRIDEILFN